MSRPLIVIGDRTDHGGTVITGTPTSDIDGRPIARVGDRVTCPIKGHGGTTVIVSGDPTLIVDGASVARHGDKCACGATLLAGQVLTFTDQEHAAARPTSFGDGNVRAAAFQGDAEAAFDRRFLVIDRRTKVPLTNVPYRLTLPTGQELVGRTDNAGLTGLVFAATALMANIEVPFYGDDASNADAASGYDACGC